MRFGDSGGNKGGWYPGTFVLSGECRADTWQESAANESRVSVIQEGTGLKKYRNPVQEENIFKIEESRIIEDPFEWNISFRPSKESGWLQWKIAKTEQEDSPGPIPPALAVHAKDILLLKDNAYE